MSSNATILDRRKTVAALIGRGITTVEQVTTYLNENNYKTSIATVRRDIDLIYSQGNPEKELKNLPMQINTALTESWAEYHKAKKNNDDKAQRAWLHLINNIIRTKSTHTKNINVNVNQDNTQINIQNNKIGAIWDLKRLQEMTDEEVEEL